MDRLSGCRLFHCFALSPFRLWYGRLFLPTGRAVGSHVAADPGGQGTVVEGGFVGAVASFVESIFGVECIPLLASFVDMLTVVPFLPGQPVVSSSDSSVSCLLLPSSPFLQLYYLV